MESVWRIVFVFCLKISSLLADVYVITGQNTTSFPSEAALFGPRIPHEGTAGRLMLSVPIDACSDVEKVSSNGTIWIALIKRQPCTFALKVFNVQKAGYGAAIVHNVGSDDLVPMRGDESVGRVVIPSVFVGASSGLALSQLTVNYTILLKDEGGGSNPSLFYLPFAVVLPLCTIIMCFFFGVRCVVDIVKKKKSRLSKSNLKKLPIKKFKKGDKFETCAVCLEEYEDGDRLRELPCAHVYHQKCIDPWLTKNKQTCPLCNKKVFPTDDDSDVENGNEESRSNENTPLLTSRGNAMSNYGISVASSNNVQQEEDSDSDESNAESPNDGRPNRVESRVEVHTRPRNIAISADDVNSSPAFTDTRLLTDVSEAARTSGSDVAVQNNAGFSLNEDCVDTESSVEAGADGSSTNAQTDPFNVEIRRTSQPGKMTTTNDTGRRA